MALYKGLLTALLSGSVGGNVFSHNAGGQYIRKLATPTDPNTIFQQAVRNAMTQLSTAWVETLTQTQRDAWEVYGQNVATVNRIGDTIFLAGIDQYVRSNVSRIQSALPRVDNAPTIFNIGSFTDPTIALDQAADEIDLTFDNVDDWANEDDAAMLLFAGRPQNQSVNFFKGPYRLAGNIAGDAITPPTSPAAIPAPFPIALGQRVFVRIAVTRADGRLSASFRLSADS